jgi:hypothetical protein
MRIDATNHRAGPGSARRYGYEQFDSIVTFNPRRNAIAA